MYEEEIDWKCQVYRLYKDTNMGLTLYYAERITRIRVVEGR